MLINLSKKIEDVVMHCYLKVGNSVFNKVVKKVKLILPNANSFFNLPFPRLLRKGFRGTVKKGVTIENNSNMVKKFFLLFPDSKKGPETREVPWCPKSASQCRSSGWISSTSTGKC